MNPSVKVNQKRPPSLVGVILLTLAFYLSGFFIILTPIPMIYWLMANRKSWGWELILPLLAILTALYWWGTDWILAYAGNKPETLMWWPIPGLQSLARIGKPLFFSFGLGYFSFYFLMALGIARILRGKPESNIPFFTLTLSLLGIGLLYYSVVTSYFGHHPIQFFENYLNQVFGDFLALQEKSGAKDAQFFFQKQNLPSIVRNLLLMAPGVIFCSLFTLVAINTAMAKRLFQFFFPHLFLIRFNRFSLPFFPVWIVIGLLSLWLFTNYLYPVPALKPFIYNSLIILGFSYFLHGATLVSFFSEKFQFRFFGRFFIYASILLFFRFTALILLSFGFFDSWFDFRKLSKTTKGA